MESKLASVIPTKDRDPILGLNIEFETDHRDFKVNAGVGVVIDDRGEQFMPKAIRSAMPIIKEDRNLGYISPTGESEWLGNPSFIEGSVRYIYQDFADDLIDQKRVAAVATAGGSRAISQFLDMMKYMEDQPRLLLSNPSWPVHTLMEQVRSIPHLEYDHLCGQSYDIDAHLEAIKKSRPNTVVLFQTGKSHNPTGVNPSTESEWRELAQAMEGRTAFFDTAYAGLVDSHIDDTQAIRIFYEEGVQTAVALSYSKNAGLYKYRTGALIFATDNSGEALQIQRFQNYLSRGVDSSPPATGQEIMAKIFENSFFYTAWQQELSNMALRLKLRRRVLSEAIPQLDYLKNQSGLYALLPLTKDQITTLKDEYGVYMLASGRINIGGIPSDSLSHVVDSLNEVLKN